MGMWSFEVKDLNAVIARAVEQEYDSFRGLLTYEHPLLGTIHSITFLDPDGFLVEIYQVTSTSKQ